MIGIYKITNLETKKIYVGSSKNISNRWAKHKALLRHNKHENIKLQNAWNKYGEKNFIFEIVEECLLEVIFEREQFYLDTLLFAKEFKSKIDKRFDEIGYNICPDVYFMEHNSESIKKISETLKRRHENKEISTEPQSKKCYQYNRFTGELINIWESVNSACRHYNTPNKTTSVIHRNLWGKTPSAFDSVFSYIPLEFIWARAPQKRDTLIVIDVLEKTYSFHDCISSFLESIKLNPKSQITITKCINNESLFKKQYKCFKIDAPIIYDRKPFELLGTREDLVTKTNEEIQGVNVKNTKLCDNQQLSS